MRFIRHLIIGSFTMLIATAATMAAERNVTGVFVEKATGEKLPVVTYHIYAKADTTKALLSGAADVNGRFRADIPEPGDYLLKANSLEAAPLSINFSLNETAEDLDLGSLLMLPVSQELSEVTVMARKAVISSDGAKTTYNVSEDPAATTNSVSEMLRRVPGVTVSNDGDIEVNGSSDFKIYVNGRPDPMLSSNAKEVLKAMPASAIQKIEVINEPGAKYDAEGTGGILNIVTEVKQSLDGYLATLSARVGPNNSNLSAYGRTKINKVTADANVIVMPRFASLEKNWQTEKTTFTENETLDYSSQSMAIRNKVGVAMGSFSLSWEPDTLNLFTLGASLRNFGIRLGMNSDYALFGRVNQGMLQSFHRKAEGHMNMDSWGASASYQRFLPGQGHYLVLTYMYDNDSRDITLDNYYTETHNYEPDDMYTQTYSRLHNNTHTFSFDYTLPFGVGQLLETGLKGVLRHNPGLSYNSNGFSQADATVDEKSRVDMTQFQRIGCAYISWTGNWQKWGLRTGLRYEYTRMGADFYGGDRPDFASTLNDLVPDVALTYSFAPPTNLRLSYQMRISRPSLDEINPYEMSIVDKYVQMGNPDLSSQRNNVVTLTYTNFAGRIGGNFRVGYGRMTNLITQIATVQGDMVYQKMENAGTRDEVAIEGMLNLNVINGMRVSLNGGVNYRHYMMRDASLDRDGWTGNFSVNANYSRSKWNFMAYGGLSVPRLSLYSSGWRSYYYGVSASRSMLKENRLTLSLTALSFLTPYMRTHSLTEMPGAIVRADMKRRAWDVSLGISWRLGSLRQSVKTTANSGALDDASGAEKSGMSQTPK